jgi:predicted Zn finger-like uncharacterized protein
MAAGRRSAFNMFTCPNCGALYQIVKVEAGPETDNREVACRACGTQLAGREAHLVLKYFLLRKGLRARRRERGQNQTARGCSRGRSDSRFGPLHPNGGT